MLVKSYFVFLSLAITTIFFDKAVQRCRIWQRWFIFITPFAATSLFFFRFLSFCLRLAPSFPFNSPPPPPFLFPPSFLPFLVLSPSGSFIVTLCSFKCSTHFVNGASVVAGNREDPVLLLPGSRGPGFSQFPAAFEAALIGFSRCCRRGWHTGATNSACPSGLFSIDPQVPEWRWGAIWCCLLSHPSLYLPKQQTLPLPFYPFSLHFFCDFPLSATSLSSPLLQLSQSFCRTSQTTFFSCATSAAVFKQNKCSSVAWWGATQPLTQCNGLKGASKTE